MHRDVVECDYDLLASKAQSNHIGNYGHPEPSPKKLHSKVNVNEFLIWNRRTFDFTDALAIDDHTSSLQGVAKG